MGWMEGLLGGFLERKTGVEAENIRQAELASAREANLYQALLGSDNPEIVNMAVSGLLESAQPRKKKGGLRGWIGETEASPVFQRLQSYLQTPQQVPVEETRETLPARFGTGAAQAPSVTPAVMEPPPAGAPAAMASGSPVSPSAPPPTPWSYTQAPPQPYTLQTGMTSKLPMVFLPPRERAVQEARARGEQEGAERESIYNSVYRAERNMGSTHEQAIAAARMAAGGSLRAGAAGNTYAEGEVVADTTSPTGWSQILYLRADPNVRQRIPASAPTARSSRAVNSVEQVAFQMFGRPGEDPRATMARLSPAEMAQVTQRKQALDAEGAGETTRAQGLARVETELDMPIGTTAGTQYGVPPTTTLRQLANTIGLTTEQRQRVYSIGQVDVLIDTIDRLLPEVFPKVEEGLRGRLKSQLSLGAQRLAADADLAQLDAAINGALAQIAQLSGQPGSRLSDRDIEIARGQLASLQPSLFGGDTLQTAQARMQIVKNLLEKARAITPGSVTMRPAGPPPVPTTAATPPATPVVGKPYQDAQGNWVIP